MKINTKQSLISWGIIVLLIIGLFLLSKSCIKEEYNQSHKTYVCGIAG